MDGIDRSLVALLREDATMAYAALGRAVGLSGGAAHDRVRKLRERGVIRRTTTEGDPVARGCGMLAFALIDVLRRIFDTEGVVATQAIVVLETFFERPPCADA